MLRGCRGGQRGQQTSISRSASPLAPQASTTAAIAEPSPLEPVLCDRQWSFSAQALSSTGLWSASAPFAGNPLQPTACPCRADGASATDPARCGRAGGVLRAALWLLERRCCSSPPPRQPCPDPTLPVPLQLLLRMDRPQHRPLRTHTRVSRLALVVSAGRRGGALAVAGPVWVGFQLASRLPAGAPPLSSVRRAAPSSKTACPRGR